ncbi:MAG: xanthine dehydrogenase small subunit [Rhodobacteraceae bacterium]|jgi:xanthine dehydrogenase small subunit|nr:xanthine dehydrogenase small subunit [Paracoccaceae bacterium]
MAEPHATTTFVLNGAPVTAETAPTATLLDWLRGTRGLTGTKEGCNEGDCGACTVMVTGPDGVPRALNACILFVPQLQGRTVRTVEGLAAPDGTPHPVQTALVTHHGSQCGFCTPGIAVALATAHATGATDHADRIAGNLCRCTGYAPILRAARATEGAPVPAHLAADRAPAFDAPQVSSGGGGAAPHPGGRQPPVPVAPASDPLRPTDLDAFADWYAANPDATLIAGATDVGLWVTKQMRDLPKVAFLSGLTDLRGVEVTDTHIRIGAGATLNDLRPVMEVHHPAFAELIRRYGSDQVRNAATVGGNIANGSPIGDSAPPLIALGATLHLRRGRDRRTMALEDFFLAYGKQDRQPGEFVEAVTIPRQPDRLQMWKVSKRFDQDISAICGAFRITVDTGTVTDARIAFGGMAATPRRARAVEAVLIGRPWTEATIRAAMGVFADDYQPISDMRASAAYRQTVARNLLLRAWLADQGTETSVLRVTA